jgi:hypothetical protein
VNWDWATMNVYDKHFPGSGRFCGYGKNEA